MKQNTWARRVAQLAADLENSRAAVRAEQDQGRLLELMRQHVALQDALLDVLLHGTSKVIERRANASSVR